ncbi:MAG TPA: CHAT domain-containing protein [Acetobacteraceae bacterium]|jgi:CHAT domain-containing protein/tetratricopeptide (TPR) repeat protein|nr:CHAT domain-containing protein [Acetobacteraceae bacterium]
MRATALFRMVPVLIATLLPGCQEPPPDAYVHGGAAATRSAAQVSIGKNSVGEDCTQSAQSGQSADVFCGTWQQPSARVRSGGAGHAGELAQLATASQWRNAIDTRFRCEPPQATTILGSNPAELLQCTQLIGGWAHVAMVAHVGGSVWYADGVLPAASVMERSIGVLAGVTRADAVAPTSAADALLANRLAAKAFSSGDIGQFDALMAAGTRANLADNPGAAETAFRAALALQQKALGKDNPNTATAVVSLALQLSNEGRTAEAGALFADAEKLAPAAADATAPARLLHYRGLDALNQGHLDDALKLLNQADAAYAAGVPADALNAKGSAARAGSSFARSGELRLADLMPAQDLLTDPRAQAALLGLIEVRRNRAVVLRLLNQSQQADDVLASAIDLARGNGLSRPILTARLYRTSGVTAASQGQNDAALQDLTQSTEAFTRALPGSKPLAETYLLRARELLKSGIRDAALPVCRNAIEMLTALKTGTTPELMDPCLDVYANAADRLKDQHDALLDEMFIAAQLAQGGITSQQIAQATARLSENSRDPKVAEAIRKRQDASARLADLYRQRDDLADAQKQGSTIRPGTVTGAELDKQVGTAQAALADADAALQAASPNYGQLVQQVASAKDVFAALHPAEAFAAITLGSDKGWIFLLHSGTITVSRIDGGVKQIAALVRRIRAGIELTTAGLPTFDIPDDQKLYQMTLGGVAGALQGVKSLVVAPAGPLLSLPFEVLLTGPAQDTDLASAPWLARQFTIAHVPAPSNFVSLRKIAAGSRAARPWFGFGDFQPVTLAQAEKSFPGDGCGDSAKLLSELALLPGARKELDAARALLGAGANDELLGASFTADAVLRTHLKDYRILQFSTHAILPSDLRCQSEPAIITSAPPNAPDASGALLTASKVMGLDLDADTVILSACNSGGPGGATAGESLSGLARAFFYAGARSLAVTHWEVSDKVTAFLVADTLRRLHDNPNVGIVGALRDAQLAMLADAGKGLPAEIAHPFFWAPFAVIGEGGEKPAVSADGLVSPRHLAGL